MGQAGGHGVSVGQFAGHDRACHPAVRPGAVLRLRVRERLPRHRQRRRDGHLHQLAHPHPGGDVVGAVELPGGGELLGRGRLCHCGVAAGRAHPSRPHRGGLRHGLGAAPVGHHLERRHLVSRPAGVQFAHPDRLDRGRRPDELVDRRPRFRRGRELGQGRGDRGCLGDVATDRLFGCRGRADAGQAPDQESRSLSGAQRRRHPGGSARCCC
jgi:hypothetical protein